MTHRPQFVIVVLLLSVVCILWDLPTIEGKTRNLEKLQKQTETHRSSSGRGDETDGFDVTEIHEEGINNVPGEENENKDRRNLRRSVDQNEEIDNDQKDRELRPLAVLNPGMGFKQPNPGMIMPFHQGPHQNLARGFNQRRPRPYYNQAYNQNAVVYRPPEPPAPVVVVGGGNVNNRNKKKGEVGFLESLRWNRFPQPIFIPVRNPPNATVPPIATQQPVQNPVNATDGTRQEEATGPPTTTPTRNPTRSPTKRPTQRPTRTPTKRPTPTPTRPPTRRPTRRPTKMPSRRPTRTPTKRPTRRPTKMPTPGPTRTPTRNPTRAPTNAPTRTPTTTSRASIFGYIDPIDTPTFPTECKYAVESLLDGTNDVTATCILETVPDCGPSVPAASDCIRSRVSITSINSEEEVVRFETFVVDGSLESQLTSQGFIPPFDFRLTPL